MNTESCGPFVRKRNLRVEGLMKTPNFVQTFGFPRYYETCVLERKGAFSLRTVVVTEACVLFFAKKENPLVALPFQEVEDIEMVPDRTSIIKSVGNQACLSQHIRITHKRSRDKREVPSGGGSSVSSSSSSSSESDTSSLLSILRVARSSSSLSYLQETYEPNLLAKPGSSRLLLTPSSDSQVSSFPRRRRERRKGQAETEERSRSLDPAGNGNEPELLSSQALDFYLYQGNSLLLNELILFWNRAQLNSLLSTPWTREKGVREAEKALSKLEGSWRRDATSSSWSSSVARLEPLHRAMLKMEHLPRLCWKEPLLLQALESLAERGAGSASEGLALLLDIFRLLYSAVGVSWVRSFRSLEALSTFLLSLVLEKVLPLTGGIGVMRRPREYAEGQWLSSRGNREEILRLSLLLNVSVALVHEILQVHSAKLLHSVGRTQLETLLCLSMTQMISLLWEDGKELSERELGVLVRHAWVTELLGRQEGPWVWPFLAQNFREEFRYYLSPAGIARKTGGRRWVGEKVEGIRERILRQDD